MSRQELRFEQFCRAQQALFDAEARLNARLDDEIKAREQFEETKLTRRHKWQGRAAAADDGNAKV